MAWEDDIADVVPGEFIEDTWGNAIRDRGVHILPNFASLPDDVTDGGVAYVNSTDLLYLRSQGAWVALPAGGPVVASSAVSASVGIPSITAGAVATVTVPIPWPLWTVTGTWSFVATATDAGANPIVSSIWLDDVNIGTQWNSRGIAEGTTGAASTTTLAGTFHDNGSGAGDKVYEVRADRETGSPTVDAIRRQLVITAYRRVS